MNDKEGPIWLTRLGSVSVSMRARRRRAMRTSGKAPETMVC
jgi:hypothetical protein